jgi:hypothetical protein
MSQFPHYSAAAFWEVQHSDHSFGNIFKLAVGNTTWQTQQLYHYQSTEDNTHLAILCTLACKKLGVDYGVDVLYQVPEYADLWKIKWKMCLNIRTILCWDEHISK